MNGITYKGIWDGKTYTFGEILEVFDKLAQNSENYSALEYKPNHKLITIYSNGRTYHFEEI